MAQKPRVAIFDFTGCEGCELNQLNFEDQLLDILAHVDIVEWREAMDDRVDEYDIAFVEGSLSTPDCITRINEVRRKAKVLVALGACAVQGGINGMKNTQPIEEVREEVYGEDKYLFPTLPALPISAVVKVDYNVRGCPMTQIEFLKVFTALVMGKEPIEPEQSVCVECKLKENECVFEQGHDLPGPRDPRRLRRPLSQRGPVLHRLPRSGARAQPGGHEGDPGQPRSVRGRGLEATATVQCQRA